MILQQFKQQLEISCAISGANEPKQFFRIFELKDQRQHKATLWKNIRYHQRHGCEEHAELLRKVFAPILNLYLPRIPRHGPKNQTTYP